MKLIIEESSLTLKLTNEDLISLRDKGMVQQETKFLSNDLSIFVDIQHVITLQGYSLFHILYTNTLLICFVFMWL